MFGLYKRRRGFFSRRATVATLIHTSGSLSPLTRRRACDKSSGAGTGSGAWRRVMLARMFAVSQSWGKSGTSRLHSRHRAFLRRRLLQR